MPFGRSLPELAWICQDNAQGVGTSLSYLVLTAVIATQLGRRSAGQPPGHRRGRGEPARAVFYAIVQRVGYDPVYFAGLGNRVFSTLGQPVYLAGYLGMVFPLTLWRMGTQFQKCRSRPEVRTLAGFAFYSLIAVTQLVAFAFTESRGPLLGLAASVTLFAILWACFYQRPRLLLVPLLVVGLLLLPPAVLGQRKP